MTPRRGDVWLVDFGEPWGREQAGRRPGVVVSDDDLNDGPSGLTIIVPVTSSRRGLPSHVELDGAATGLDEVSYAKCEDIKSVAVQRLVARLGSVDAETMFHVERVLRYLVRL